MQALGKLFLKGLAVVVPVALTLAILWWLAAGAERWLGNALQLLLPEHWYVPGMGLAAGISLVFLAGLLSHVLIMQKLFNWGENLLSRLPLVKTLYSALRDFVDYFSMGSRGDYRKVVLVQLPQQPFSLIGFVTRESLDYLQLPEALEDKIAVYLPMSYQIGGYTIHVSPQYVTPLELSFEEAMRLVITAGVAGGKNDAA